MTFSEWIDIATAIILLFTLIAVFWYTVETQRLRRVASKQLAIQLGHLKPFFQCPGGSRLHQDGHGNARAVANLRNRGGSAYEVRVSSHGDFSLKLGSESDYIGAGEDLILDIQGKNLDALGELPFRIEFLDGLGERHTLHGIYKGGKISLREEKG